MATYVRPHLNEGWIELLDHEKNLVAEWYDKRYASAILRGECTVQRWGQLIFELAAARGYMIQTAAGWTAVNDSKRWTDDLPAGWEATLGNE